MVKVFRVYQNFSNVGSYFNRWASNTSTKSTEHAPQLSDIPYYEKLTEFTNIELNASSKAFGYRFRIEDDEFLLYAENDTNIVVTNHVSKLNSIMFDVTQYIRINYRNEIESGNMTKTLTQFLNGYFKQYENVIQKQRKIDTLKHGLNSMHNMASETFMTIIERGKAIGELKTEIDSISNHGVVFNKKSKRLKNKIWVQRLRAYLYIIGTIFIVIVLFYLVF